MRDLKPKVRILEEENRSLRHNIKNQRRYENIDNEKEESRETRRKEDNMHQQEKNTHIEDMLGRILERLEKLEKADDSIGEDTANRS